MLLWKVKTANGFAEHVAEPYVCTVITALIVKMEAVKNKWYEFWYRFISSKTHDYEKVFLHPGFGCSTNHNDRPGTGQAGIPGFAG
jgi:hypothetical protein